jgi:KipI family sensor histidine kinase inhibitor
VPCAFGGEAGPQLAEVAQLVGSTEAEAVKLLTGTTVRVLTLGFAPGQPYLGTLPPAWDIPRQQGLTASVPGGALVVAVRQLVLFTAATPTGWRHVGQTAFSCFRPDSDAPFALRAGDEMRFRAVGADEIAALRAQGPDGGATCEAIR